MTTLRSVLRPIGSKHGTQLSRLEELPLDIDERVRVVEVDHVDADLQPAAKDLRIVVARVEHDAEAQSVGTGDEF